MMVETAERLAMINPHWRIHFNQPDGDGWLSGHDLSNAHEGNFNPLLEALGARLQTHRRKVIAASFALRFGWASALLIGPYLLDRRVPEIGLDDVSFRFNAQCLFEQAAMHSSDFPCRENASPADLQAALVAQTRPVVATLSSWSRYSEHALWGQVTSSWTGQFISILEQLDSKADVLEQAQAFMAASALPDKVLPQIYEMRDGDQVRRYQKRASCCLYFKTSKEAGYCLGCPIATDSWREERVKQLLQQPISA